MDKTELEAKTIKELRVIAENLGTRRLNAHTRKEDIIKAILEASGGKSDKAENVAEKSAKAESKPAKAENKPAKAESKPAKAESKPAKAESKPAKAESKPAKTESKPAKADEKPAKAESKADKKPEAKPESKPAKTTKAAPKAAESLSKSNDSAKAVASSSSVKKPTAKKPKSAKSGAKAIDPELSALLDALEGKSTKAEEDVKVAEKEKTEEIKEPAPVEPEFIFIDRGPILPEYIPGTCLFALVRDPGTIFVYWNAEFESEHGWLLTAYDKGGNILQQFTTPVRRSGRGYFHVPSSLAARVTLSAITSDGSSEVRLESKIRIAEQLGVAQPNPSGERWVDFKSHEVISEAPAPGHAPNAPSYVDQISTPAIAGGGFDRSIEVWFGSSRFGSLNESASAPSDKFVGSSDIIIRRR